MPNDQLDLLGFADSAPPWVPTTPAGRKPAKEYELFLALRPDVAGQHGALLVSVESLQQRYRAPTSKLRKPSLWHVTLLDVAKFTTNYPHELLTAIESACDGVMGRRIAVTHEGLVSFRPSDACVLTCSAAATQAVTQQQQDLAAALRNRRIKCRSATAAHMTIFYDSEHHLPPTPLDEPLSWTADGFALLCSHKGLGYHEFVRAWPAKL